MVAALLASLISLQATPLMAGDDQGRSRKDRYEDRYDYRDPARYYRNDAQRYRPRQMSRNDLALHLHACAVLLGDLTGDWQAEAGAASVPRPHLVGAPEALEDVRLVLRRNARSGVGDGDVSRVPQLLEGRHPAGHPQGRRLVARHHGSRRLEPARGLPRQRRHRVLAKLVAGWNQDRLSRLERRRPGPAHHEPGRSFGAGADHGLRQPPLLVARWPAHRLHPTAQRLQFRHLHDSAGRVRSATADDLARQRRTRALDRRRRADHVEQRRTGLERASGAVRSNLPAVWADLHHEDRRVGAASAHRQPVEDAMPRFVPNVRKGA